MLDFIQNVHSIVRWVIVLVALIAVVRFALGWLRKMSYESMDRGLMSGLTGLVDLQLLLGLILLFGKGIERFRLEHAGTMILAIVVLHAAMRWRQAPAAIKFRNNLVVIVIAMILIVGGVFALPQGWG